MECLGQSLEDSLLVCRSVCSVPGNFAAIIILTMNGLIGLFMHMIKRMIVPQKLIMSHIIIPVLIIRKPPHFYNPLAAKVGSMPSE